MTALTFFTAKLTYTAIVADEATDLDTDPQAKGFFATVMIHPFILNGDGVDATEIQAGTLTPDVSMLVLAPVRARIDNGILMLRTDPDRDVDNFANMAAFPATGAADQLYRDTSTGKVFEWTGSAYAETDDFAVVRLVAQTAVLGLPEGATLNYRLDFSNVVYNGGDQKLASFAFAAPTSDVVLDLATAPRIAL